MTDTDPPLDPGPIDTLAAQCVRSLFDRHGVKKPKQASAVTEILKLSYSQGTRRLTTNATWSLEELRQVAAHFGESLTELLANSQLDVMVSATFKISSLTLPCRVVPGDAVTKLRSGALVATMVDGAWFVLPASSDLKTAAFDVVRLVIEPPSANLRRIAVLDDHLASAENLTTYLAHAGFDPVLFSSLELLQAAASSNSFDGYVLDWIIEDNAKRETVRALVASIRDNNSACPIIVLTGQMRHAVDVELDIASAVEHYNLSVFEKPASLPIIAGKLRSLFMTP